MNATVAIGILIYAYTMALPPSDLIPLGLTVLLATIPAALPATFTLSAAFGADNVSYAKDNRGRRYGDYDLALSSNQAAFAATGYFYDVDLNAESYVGLNLREMMNISDLYGEKRSGCTTLFQTDYGRH